MTRQVRAALVAVIAAVGGLLLSASPASATFPGNNGLIAYTHAGNIYTIEPTGIGPRQLTRDGHDSGPTWSPNGKQIAFTRVVNGYSELFVMNANGSGVRHIPTAPLTAYGPSWSPDGVTVAFVDEASQEIYTVNTSLRQSPFEITRQPITALSGTSWSPDGKSLLFVGDDGNQCFSGFNDTCIMVFTFATDTTTPIWYSNTGCFADYGDSPSWGPGAKHLLFIETQVDCDITPSWVDQLNPDGSGYTVIDAPQPPLFDGPATFSPNFGTQIAFTRYTCRSQYAFAGCGTHSIIVAKANGTDQHTIATGEGPDWQPLPRA